MTDLQLDPEIAAMSAVAVALSGLDVDAQARVLRWGASRYGMPDLKVGGISSDGDSEEKDDRRGKNEDDGEEAQFATIHDLFERVTIKTQIDKALVAAYWFQVVQGANGFGSMALNTELKNMGIGIPNITDALSSAESAKPALVMQTSKAGKSRQARKTYKLTTAGIKFVQAMIRDDE